MIINCKCSKYQFDIPDHEITGDGRFVRCEFCNEEWFQENPNQQNVETNIPGEEIPIPKPHKTVTADPKITKPKKNKFGLLTLSLIIFIFVIYLGILENKALILSNYPFFAGFYESSDILKEVMAQNFAWLKELFQNFFK